MEKKPSVGIIGCGNIGAALGRALCKAEYKVFGFDLNRESLEKLYQEVGVKPLDSIARLLEEVDVVVIAVKPHIVPDVCHSIQEVAKSLESVPLVISVAAGVKVSELSTVLGDRFSVVRVMPNLAMSLGLGMSTYYTQKSGNADTVEMIFGQVGKVCRVETEELIDVATALAGSGPAFVFYLINAMIKGAKDLGFGEKRSKLVACQTARGAIELLESSELDAEELISRVATPGGTTEAGIKVLSEAGVEKILAQAITASAKRAGEKMSNQEKTGS